MSKYCALLAIAIAYLSRAGLAMAQMPIGEVSEIRGQAELKRGSGITPIAVKTQIELHDQITLKPNSYLTIALVNGRQIQYQGAFTQVVDEAPISPSGIMTRLATRLLSGNVRAIVSSALGGVFDYQVHTSNALIAVSGTDFEVAFSVGAARPGFSGCGVFTDVNVYTGVVSVANAAGTVMVEGGYATTVPCLGAPLSPGPLGLAGKGVQPAHAASLIGAPPPQCPPCVMSK
jgi:hypothetical protein